jgi:hypothetical protein
VSVVPRPSSTAAAESEETGVFWPPVVHDRVGIGLRAVQSLILLVPRYPAALVSLPDLLAVAYPDVSAAHPVKQRVGVDIDPDREVPR